MNYSSKKRLDHPPHTRQHFYSQMYQKLETTLPPPEIDLETDITFFGNEPASGANLGYDQFFSFTKVLPLYDKRKERENRGFIPDTWEKIHQQEAPPKPVPATSSQWYGRLPAFDLERSKFGRIHQLGNFYSTRGALQSAGEVKYTEEIRDFRL